jgi:hypothetical protein
MANFVYYLGVRIIRLRERRINDVNRVYTEINDTELEGFGSEDTDDVQPDDNDDDDYNLVWNGYRCKYRCKY